MDIYERTLKVDSIDDVARIYLISDSHLGEIGAHVRFMRDLADYIAHDPNGAVMTLGDLAGFIAPDDRRFDPEQVAEGLQIEDLADWGSVMVELVANVLAPLKGRIICSLSGNHEDVYARRTHARVNRDVARKLGSEPLGYSAFVLLRFVDLQGREAVIRFAMTHGGSGATTHGGKLQALIKWSEGFGGVDVYAMGHVHACIDGWAPPRLGERDGEIVEWETPYCIVTGTALRTYVKGHSGYGERKGYRPTHIGYPCLCLVPSTRDMWTRWIFERSLSGRRTYAGAEPIGRAL